jgi:hypothetical protein
VLVERGSDATLRTGGPTRFNSGPSRGVTHSIAQSDTSETVTFSAANSTR